MKFQAGEKAINWVKPTIPSWWPASDEAYKDLAFNTQTSTIRCWYDQLTNLFTVQVHHNGKKMGMQVAAEAAGTKEGALLVKQSFMDGWDLDVHDRKIVSALFDNLFGPEKPKSAWHPSTWAGIDSHISWKDEIAEFKGGYASGGMISQGSYGNYYQDHPYYSNGTHYPTNHAKDLFAPDKTSSFLENKSQELPGVNETVKHPVTGEHRSLARVIINLNDEHKWTREHIADWIETLDIDTTFPVEYTEPNKEEV